MKKNIDTIVYSKEYNQVEKYALLKELFLRENIHYFSDFDDTITDNNCVFYTKVKILKKKKKFNQENIQRIINNIKINSNYPNIKEKIVIISRNDQYFLDVFMEKYQSILKEKGINIVAWIWTNENFKYSSKEKLLFMNNWDTFIWDSFEDKYLQDYEKFINAFHISWVKKYFIYIKKIFILCNFFIKWC